ncbi:MAG TPA: F0F1 ATP synthase subunit epsilon [Verrucomicrobiae bacterium]|nr:F0F1 ATP synthase subunit epsilon [Verrucomicrobiae bacterium]
MRAFAIALSSMDCSERIDGVTAFCAGDRSGRFGILAGREPLATTLSWGLCSLRIGSEANRQYLAVPGGVLYFAQDVLHLCARLYLRDDDPERIVQRLTHEMHAEEESSRSMHALLRDLDRELMRRLTGELSR